MPCALVPVPGNTVCQLDILLHIVSREFLENMGDNPWRWDGKISLVWHSLP